MIVTEEQFRLARYLSLMTANHLKWDLSIALGSSSSVDDLVKNLNKDQFKNLKEFFPVESEFNFVMRKVIFPYDYVDSITKLAETSLPPKDAFYSGLKGEGITDEDVKHEKKG